MYKRQEYQYNNGKARNLKGNFTWYNFDRSVKVETNINDLVKWDDALMAAALENLNDYLAQNLTDTNELIAGLVQSAFSNTKGQIDTGKVFQILKYKEKIKHKKFQQACELITNAQSIDSSRKYMRLWVVDDAGKYQNINLNFSSL